MTNQPTLFDSYKTNNTCCPTCHRPYTLENPGKTGKTHPKTSRTAATLPKFGTQRHKVLTQLVHHGPQTAHQLAHTLNLSPNQIATRLLELREQGLVTYHTIDGHKVEHPTTRNNTGYLQTATPLGHHHINTTTP